ncbi:unnamed protein product [Aphanomyces euteiches]|uniref:Uncharacterized protein n=1 Tax=Aphanomyces euteiches TaxID=100861 RepID=A0A6G0WIQ3_9STRA|nr:hypothetical protein Ae201684_014826 [Aphanomyces euteiches]KAH9072652.1 hypothetical protein Ae201684P_015725 [Aphanomyces euteiches]KAH9149796.1 hypothetical protein AeRB84_007250 [Aphanomyces euteiches]
MVALEIQTGVYQPSQYGYPLAQAKAPLSSMMNQAKVLKSPVATRPIVKSFVVPSSPVVQQTAAVAKPRFAVRAVLVSGASGKFARMNMRDIR